MSPFIERINDQWLHPFVERLNTRQQVLREKGNDFIAGLQERQEKLFDRGQRAINHFETTVLERVADLLSWSYTRTGERSDVLKKTLDYVAERIEELQAVDDDAPLFDEEELDGIETLHGSNGHAEAKPEPKPKKAAKKTAAKKTAKADKKAEKADKKAVTPPFENYDKLNVKKLATRFNDLNAEQLEQAREYEAANKQRKTVFETIDRLLS